MTDTRTETDSLGPIEVPADAYWGAQTQRAVQNFPISGRPVPGAVIHAFGQLKAAAARANAELERITGMDSRIDDLETLVELGTEEGDADTLAEAETELTKVAKAVSELEVRTLLSGEYDEREAIVTIRSGAASMPPRASQPAATFRCGGRTEFGRNDSASCAGMFCASHASPSRIRSTCSREVTGFRIDRSTTSPLRWDR